MSYHIRGNNCVTVSNALTSNAKYIAPLSNVYYDQWTDMYLYPGYTGFTYPYQHPFGPDILKAWNLETHRIKFKHQHEKKYHKRKETKCSTCSKTN